MKLSVIALILLSCLRSSAQVIFEPLTFEQGLERAEREGKYLMVILDAKECDYCNEVADRSFASTDLGNALAKKFITIRPKLEDDTWMRFSQQFDAPTGMVTLFFSSTGVLLYRHNGTSSSPKYYADAAHTALSKESEILNLKTLEDAYKREKNNLTILQALLLKRKELWLSTDELLDEYVKLLPADSLTSLAQLQFIAQLAPTLSSYANQKLREDYDLFNQAWYRMDLPTRVRINNQIIFKSRQIAIARKDKTMATRVANFAASTNNTPATRHRGYLINMMEFYRATNDSSSYLMMASDYYDRYLMKMKVDSIQLRDSLETRRLFALAKPDTIQDPQSKKTTFRKSINFRPASHVIMNDLNKGAWNFYLMTRRPDLLTQALQWSARALEFYRAAEVLDTHARLLYVSGKKEEAIKFETEAIAKKKSMGFSSAEYEKVLANMQSGKEKID